MITLNEFFDSKENLAIHCNTKEKANKLLKEFDKLGERWYDGSSYILFNCWDVERKNTCYSNNNHYCYWYYYKKHKYKIYEFEDIDFEDETIDELKDQIKDLQRKLNNKIKEK